MPESKEIRFFSQFPQAPGRLRILLAGFPRRATILRFSALILLLAIVLGAVEHHTAGSLELALVTFVVTVTMGLLYLGFFSALVAAYGLLEIKDDEYKEALRLAGTRPEIKRYFESAHKRRGKLLNQEMLLARGFNFKKAGFPETKHKAVFLQYCKTAKPA